MSRSKKLAILLCVGITAIFMVYFNLNFQSSKPHLQYEHRKSRGEEMSRLNSLQNDQLKSIALNICAHLRPIRKSPPRVKYDRIFDLYCLIDEKACSSDNEFSFEKDDNPDFHKERRIAHSGYYSCLRKASAFVKDHPHLKETDFLNLKCSIESLRLSFTRWHLEERNRASNATNGRIPALEFTRNKVDRDYQEAEAAHKSCTENSSDIK